MQKGMHTGMRILFKAMQEEYIVIHILINSYAHGPQNSESCLCINLTTYADLPNRTEALKYITTIIQCGHLYLNSSIILLWGIRPSK